MATALWPATWGYYLLNLIGLDGTGLTLDSIAWAREHFIAHVRPFGPLPTLRVGRQPYGVLPVTPLGTTAGGHRRRARALAARPRSRRCATGCGTRACRTCRASGAATIRRRTSPAVMKSDAMSATYRLRHLLGPRYLEHLRRFLGEDLAASGWLAPQDAGSRAVLQRAGLPLASAPRRRRVRAKRTSRSRRRWCRRASSTVSPRWSRTTSRALLADPPLPVERDRAPPPVPGAGDAAASAAAPRAAARIHGAPRRAWRATSRARRRWPALLRERELVNLNAATAVTTWRMLLTRPEPGHRRTPRRRRSSRA